MSQPESPFRASDKPAREIVDPITPHALADERGMAIIERRRNGQEFHMTYKTVPKALTGLTRAKAAIPGAQIVSFP